MELPALQPGGESESPPKWLWPFGPALVTLLLPLTPDVSFIGFKFVAAVGLIAGVAFGPSITNKHGRIQPRRKERLSVAILVAALVVVSVRYFRDVRTDAENHFYETIVEIVLVNILIGLLIFLATPAIASVLDRLRRR